MNSEKINVVLVDESDQEKGYMEKLEAHRKGELHRAVSVFLFTKKGEWILQQRAFNKYHCPGMWSNTCCTHPFPGESYLSAAQRRMNEEMGLKTDLDERFRFIYKAQLDKDLTEHELDVVFTGITDDEPVINPEEAASFRIVTSEILEKEVESHPERFTPWFLKIYPQIKMLDGQKNENTEINTAFN